MFKVSLSDLFTIYLLFILSILGIFWFFEDFLRRRREKKLRKYYMACELCGEQYWDESKNLFAKCPNCNSINERKLMREL